MRIFEAGNFVFRMRNGDFAVSSVPIIKYGTVFKYKQHLANYVYDQQTYTAWIGKQQQNPQIQTTHKTQQSKAKVTALTLPQTPQQYINPKNTTISTQNPSQSPSYNQPKPDSIPPTHFVTMFDPNLWRACIIVLEQDQHGIVYIQFTLCNKRIMVHYTRLIPYDPKQHNQPTPKVKLYHLLNLKMIQLIIHN